MKEIAFATLKIIYIAILWTSSQRPRRGITDKTLKGRPVLLVLSEWIYLTSSNVSLANKALASNKWKL